MAGTGRRSLGDPQAARLTARQGTPSQPATPGEFALSVETERDALLDVPAGYRPDEPAPLAVLLHGATGSAERGLRLLAAEAARAGLVLLAPASQGKTWDLLRGGFGPDVARLDRALAATFDRCAVDPARVALGGFSDGASYALSLGLLNADLFTHLIAFSPGFVLAGPPSGTPRLFVSHGTEDQVLRIDLCGRRVVHTLQRLGYAVTYHEFDGPHAVPPEIARAAVDWFLAGPAEPG